MLRSLALYPIELTGQNYLVSNPPKLEEGFGSGNLRFLMILGSLSDLRSRPLRRSLYASGGVRTHAPVGTRT